MKEFNVTLTWNDGTGATFDVTITVMDNGEGQVYGAKNKLYYGTMNYFDTKKHLNAAKKVRTTTMDAFTKKYMVEEFKTTFTWNDGEEKNFGAIVRVMKNGNGEVLGMDGTYYGPIDYFRVKELKQIAA